MFIVYILKSIHHNRLYIGSTENPKLRLAAHNRGRVRSTKAFRPWKFVYYEEYSIKQEARCRELQIKAYKSGEGLRKLLAPT